MAVETDSTWFQRRAAIRALVANASKGDESVVAELHKALQDSSPDVRESAARSLASVAVVGHAESLDVLGAALRDESEEVKNSAVLALGELAGGDASAIQKIVNFLSASSPESASAKVGALSALKHAVVDMRSQEAGLTLVPQLRIDIVSAAVTCVSDSDTAVARAALEFLAVLGPESSESAAINATRCAFTMELPSLRIAALRAFASLQAGHGAAAHSVVAEHLRLEQDSEVRAVALAALAEVAAEGDDEVVALLSSSTDEYAACVRKAAYEALSKAVPRGHHAAGLSVVKGLKDADSAVRKTVVTSFAAIAAHTDTALLEAAGKLLENGNKHVRSAAIEALEAVSCDGDVVLAEVCKRLCHKSKHVRNHMLEAASSHGGAGKPQVVAACVEGLQNASQEDVRFDALRALDLLFPKGNKLTLEHVARAASEDHVSKNQCFALQLLCKMGKGRRVAMLVAACALGERDAAVVQQGFKTAIEVCPSGSTYALEYLLEMLPLSHLQMHERVDRRLYIIDALAQIGAGTNHEATVLALIERTQDLNSLVRPAALKALQDVACVGNVAAIEAVAHLLEGADADMRNLAVARYHQFAAPFDSVAAHAATKRTASCHFEVRVAALHALSGVLDPGRRPPRFGDSCKLRLDYESSKLHLFCENKTDGSEPNWPDAEILSRLQVLAERDEFEPVKAAASGILRHLERWEPMPADGLGSTVYAPLGDATRFRHSGILSAVEKSSNLSEASKPSDKPSRSWTLHQFRYGNHPVQKLGRAGI